MNPKLPILHRRHPRVVSPAIHPDLLAKDRAGIDVVDLEYSGKVEIEHRVGNFAQAEVMTVTVYNADLRRRIKDPDRVLDEIRSYAIVVIQGKNIAAAR